VKLTKPQQLFCVLRLTEPRSGPSNSDTGKKAESFQFTGGGTPPYTSGKDAWRYTLFSTSINCRSRP